jgi:thiol-disulfide isomerase/thioredoxin
MGRMMPPVDIREDSQLSELSKRIATGPLTLVLVYADWCGHCQRFKPMMDKLEACPQRSIQTARIRDDVFPKSSLASAKIEGYPSLMLVNQSGEVTAFKKDSGEVTNAIPDHTNEQKMMTIVRSAGTAGGQAAMDASTVNGAGAAASTVGIAQETETNTILSDRLSAEEVGRLNSQLVKSTNTLLKEATAPVVPAPQRGGGLWSAVMRASQDLAPAAALFFAASATQRRRVSRKTRKGKGKGKGRK